MIVIDLISTKNLLYMLLKYSLKEILLMSKTELNFCWRIKENSIGSTQFGLKTTNILYRTVKKILHNLCVLEPVLKHKIEGPIKTHEVKLEHGRLWI